MSAPSIHAFAVSRIRTGSRRAAAALAFLLAGITTAGATGTQADEIKRVPVEYYTTSGCAGSSNTCVVEMVTTPAGNKKRLHVAGVSCTAATGGAEVVWLTVEGGAAPRYQYIQPQYTGTFTGNETYVATSATRFFLRRNETVVVAAVANGDILNLNCSMVGELVYYQ
jgi:hypothetical protein